MSFSRSTHCLCLLFPAWSDRLSHPAAFTTHPSSPGKSPSKLAMEQQQEMGEAEPYPKPPVFPGIGWLGCSLLLWFPGRNINGRAGCWHIHGEHVHPHLQAALWGGERHGQLPLSLLSPPTRVPLSCQMWSGTSFSHAMNPSPPRRKLLMEGVKLDGF